MKIILTALLSICFFTAAFGANRCTSDFDCSNNTICVKSLRGIDGQCVEKQNLPKKSQLKVTRKSLLPHDVEDCVSDVDCEDGYTCSLNPSDDSNGVCVAKSCSNEVDCAGFSHCRKQTLDDEKGVCVSDKT